jgi:hypothetical protein
MQCKVGWQTLLTGIAHVEGVGPHKLQRMNRIYGIVVNLQNAFLQPQQEIVGILGQWSKSEFDLISMFKFHFLNPRDRPVSEHFYFGTIF